MRSQSIVILLLLVLLCSQVITFSRIARSLALADPPRADTECYPLSPQVSALVERLRILEYKLDKLEKNGERL